MMFGAKEIHFSLPEKEMGLIRKLASQMLAGNFRFLTIKDQSYHKSAYVLTGEFVENPYFTHDQYDEITERWSLIQEQGCTGSIVECVFSPEIAKHFIECIPIKLRNLNPRFVVQMVGCDNKMIPHVDHDRTSSIMCPLITNNAETVWYEKTEDFEIFHANRILDIRKIKEVFRIELLQNKWYIFDHASGHSVENFVNPDSDRVAFCIEFEHLSPEELYEIMTNDN
jgi:hypothetical protein